MKSDASLKRWYRLINKRFFHNELPNNVCVRYVTDEDEDEDEGCEERYYGWTTDTSPLHKYVIIISRIKNPGPVAKLATLAHEMIHVKTGLRDDHGKIFSDCHEMLTERGLFRKGAILKGLTLF
jgi:hypothetical protein